MDKLQLIQSVESCRACKFRDTLRYGDLPLLGMGGVGAKLMFINLRATIDAHLTEKALDTRNEALFTKILELSGVKKKDVYITNLVKCAGPVTPAKEFMANAKTCYMKHLLEEENLIRPDAIVCFGSTIPKILLGDKDAKAGKVYVMQHGVGVMRVTHSLEELYRHGKEYMDECVATIKEAVKCLSP